MTKRGTTVVITATAAFLLCLTSFAVPSSSGNRAGYGQGNAQKKTRPQARQMANKAKQATQKISNTELKKFVKVQKKISEVQQKCVSEFQNAKKKEQRKKIRNKLYSKTDTILKNQSLTTEQYQRIATAIQNSPRLQEKFVKMQKEAQ
ncbi:MAG: DUF4168 domain-containing protein [Victivallales bacterium]|nr:DUF4168 domain-containing protein [Victivallales bacterium]